MISMSPDLPSLTLVIHNVRSAHKVGSLLRTADAFGLRQVVCTGYTPYPRLASDTRLPYVVDKLMGQITKTALGAEQTVPCSHYSTLEEAIRELRSRSHHIYALEQSPAAVSLVRSTYTFPLALIVGNEVDGLASDELAFAETVLEIPMLGTKESLNVSVAAGIALHEIRRPTLI
jgi:23S rRNA (guanosine2251-2'-O)-methyltransferase